MPTPTARAEADPVSPHGGTLVDRIESPEVVRTDRESVAESLGRILGALEERGLLEDERRAARVS